MFNTCKYYSSSKKQTTTTKKPCFVAFAFFPCLKLSYYDQFQVISVIISECGVREICLQFALPLQRTTGCGVQSGSNNTKSSLPYKAPSFVPVFSINMNRVSGAVLVGFHGISVFGRSNIHCLVYGRIKGNELVLPLSTLWAGLRSGRSLSFYPFQCYYYRGKSLLFPLTLSLGCKVRKRRFRLADLFTPTTHLFYIGS